MRALVFVLPATLLFQFPAGSPANADEFRTWKDASGKFSTQARFDKLDADSRSACLVTKAGKSIRVPYAKLSKEDQKYAAKADVKRLDAPSIGTMNFVPFSLALVELGEMYKEKGLPIPRSLRPPYPKHKDGMWVTDLPEGCPAWAAGVRVSDVIYAVDDTPVKTPEDLMWAVKGMRMGRTYLLSAERLDEEAPKATPRKQPAQSPRRGGSTRQQPTQTTAAKATWVKRTFEVSPLERAELVHAMNGETRERESAHPKHFDAEGDTVSVLAAPEMSVVTLEDKIRGYTKNTDDKYLRVIIVVQNKSRNKKIDYTGWGSNQFMAMAFLEDDIGNHYKMVDFGVMGLVGELRSASIYPEKSVTDVLVFEKPVSAAKSFTLKLKGENVGESSDLVIKFPSTGIADEKQ